MSFIIFISTIRTCLQVCVGFWELALLSLSLATWRPLFLWQPRPQKTSSPYRKWMRSEVSKLRCIKTDETSVTKTLFIYNSNNNNQNGIRRFSIVPICLAQGIPKKMIEVEVFVDIIPSDFWWLARWLKKVWLAHLFHFWNCVTIVFSGKGTCVCVDLESDCFGKWIL